MGKDGHMSYKPLTPKEQAFVREYCGPSAGNGTAAAKAAGYAGSPKVLGVQASRLLAKASVMQAMDEYRDQVKRDGVATSIDVAVRLTAIGMGMVKETRIIGGKDDFIEAEVTMPGAVQVSALKALNAQMGYDAATKTELSGTVGVVALTADQAEALDIWLLVRDDPRVVEVIAERLGGER